MSRMERVACTFALSIAALGPAGARQLVVVAPDGHIDASARVSCVDPPLPEATVDARGRVTIVDGCRHVRCASERWLPGEAPAGATPFTCALRPAAKLAIELPNVADGTLQLSLVPRGSNASLWQARATARVTTPPLALGRYRLVVTRTERSWACSTEIHLGKPEVRTVFVPWRDPVWIRGRVLAASAAPAGDVPLTTFTQGSRSWQCGRSSAIEIRSGPDGAFRLAVDPEVETLVIAGGWADSRGIAFASVRGPAGAPIPMALASPRHVIARVIDGEGRPVRCRAEIVTGDRVELWAARVAGAEAREGSCRADGALDLGPVRAEVFDVDLRPDDALPVRIPSPRPPPEGTAIDLGEIRVERGASFRVLVTDETHAPITDADVEVVSRGGFVLRRRVKSGSDGLAIVSGIPVGAAARVVVSAPGYVRAVRDAIQPDVPSEITLVPAKGVTGRVTDEQGTAVRGRVRASTLQGTTLDDADTDASGEFAFTSLPDGPVLLQAEAPGFKPSEVSRRTREESEIEPVVLVLRERAAVRGTVADARGDPVAGAMVLLVRGALEDPPEAGALDSTRSGYDGSFELASAGSPGEVVIAIARGYAAASARPAGNVELRLLPEASLRVRIPHSALGARDLVILDAGGVPRRRSAPPAGELLVDGLAPGPCTVGLDRGRGQRVELTAGTVTTVDLTGGARLYGRVSVAGRALPRAAVALAEAGPARAGAEDAVITDAAGDYTIDGAAPGDHLLVAVGAEGRADLPIRIPEDGELRVDLDIVPRSMHVLVRERGTGRPVPGAAVTAAPRGAACTGFATAASLSGDVGWDVSISNAGCLRALGSADGEATLHPARAGPYDISVQAGGFAPWTRVVDVVDGATEMIVDLARGGPPVVRVLLDTDPPLLAGTLFCVQPAKNFSRSPVAGEAACDGLAPGPAEIAFRVDDLALGRTAVEVPESGETTVHLAVPRAGRLVVPLDRTAAMVRVIDERGAAWNLPYGLGWPRCGIQNAGSPLYICREIPPGTYAVEVDGRRRAPVTVRGGETATAY